MINSAVRKSGDPDNGMEVVFIDQDAGRLGAS